MKKIILCLAGISSLLLLHSCYYDKEDLLYGNNVCNAAAGNVSYIQQVVPIFQQACYNCHTGASPSGGILMGNYTADKAIGQNGKLYGSISHAAGYAPMPDGAPALSSCQVAIIKKWVDAGLLNN